MREIEFLFYSFFKDIGKFENFVRLFIACLRCSSVIILDGCIVSICLNIKMKLSALENNAMQLISFANYMQ